jgi:hypothetical protein
MYFTVTTNVAYFMYKTGVMEEMIFKDPNENNFERYKTPTTKQKSVLSFNG